MLKFNLTKSDIKAYFDPKTFARGLEYFAQGRVAEINLQQDVKCNSLVGQVQGSQNKIYHTQVVVNNFGEIESNDCDCPIAYDCKHAVAVSLAAISAYSLDKDIPIAKPEKSIKNPQISYETQTWLQQLDSLVDTSPNSNHYPDKVKERLLYVLKKPHWSYERSKGIAVHFFLAHQSEEGSFTHVKPLSNNVYSSTARYILPLDRDILDQLELEKRRQREINVEHFYLRGRTAESILRLMISSGRCFWEDPQSTALKLAASRTATLEWSVDENGEQIAKCSMPDAEIETLPFMPPYYVDLATRKVGPIQTTIDPLIAEKLLTAPPIKPHEVQLVKNKLKQVLPAHTPQPAILQEKRLNHIIPQICLRLYAQRANASLIHAPLVSYADLSFDYDGKEVVFNEQQSDLTRVKNNALEVIVRNKKLELNAVKMLQQHGLRALSKLQPQLRPHVFGFNIYQDADEWVNFTLDVVPQLKNQGWNITLDPSYPHRLVKTDDSEWYSEIEEGSNNQWFDLELGILVEGQKINLLPVLIQAIAKLPHYFTADAIATLDPSTNILADLPDGRKIVLPLQRIKPVLQVLTELFDSHTQLKDGKLQLSALRSVQLEELMLAANDIAKFRWMGGERLLQLGKKLKTFQGITKVEPPTVFNTILRPYQQEGLNWLQFLREYDLAGILADDMGLGKTVQALAHIALEKQMGRLTKPALVIAPTSLMYNWRMEAEKFTPQLRVLTLHGVDRKLNFSDVNHYDLILTTYPLLVRDEKFLIAQEFYLLILDEAQIVKNSKAKATQIVQLLKARHRLCLSGTPMENHLGELWSLFHFLLPGLLGEQKQFARLFRTPIEKQHDSERRTALAKRIAPFLLRRTKQEVVQELPEKIEIVRNIEIEGAQRDLYESVRLAMHEKVSDAIRNKGLGRSHIVILDALLKLRQICCDPRLLKIESAKKAKAQSAKLQLLLELVQTLLEEGRQILLFSQFTEMLGLIEDELIKQKITYVKLTGKTIDRETPIKTFQSGEVKLFLISLKAGGVGLNLTAADAVIHYDPWWNPAAEQQATDRAHRIGQTKTVFVYKLITTNTVEEKILLMQQRKRTLLEGLFNEQTAEKANLTADDLTGLFADGVG